MTDVRNCTLLVGILAALVGCGSALAAQGEPYPSDRDKRLVGAWEFIYRVNEKGEQQLPHKNSGTFLDFTDKGEVTFTDIGRRAPGTEALKSGTYRIDGEEIVVTGDNGQVAKWPFVLADDVLRITMPDQPTGLYWRRIDRKRMAPGRLPRNLDKNLVGTWELTHKLDELGYKETPGDGAIARLEFTDKGEVNFSVIEPEEHGEARTKSGMFSVVGNKVVITDDTGSYVVWRYQVEKDSLAIEMTDVKWMAVWRRVKSATEP